MHFKEILRGKKIVKVSVLSTRLSDLCKKNKVDKIASQDGREKSSKIRMQVRADNGYKIGKLKGN